MSATSRSITELLSNQGRIAGNAERERAGIAAQAQRERGQIFGSTIAQIGQQIGNLPKEINQAKTLQLESQTKQLQFDALKRAQVSQASANQVLSQMPRNEDGTYDTGALIQGLSQKNVPLPVLEQLAKSIDGVNGVITSFNQSKNEHIADLANTILMNHQKGEPVTADAVHLGIAAARAAGLASQADEQKFTDLMASGAEPEQILKGVRGLGAKYKDANKPVSVAAGASLVNPSTGESVFKAPDRPIAVAPGSSLVEPSTGQSVYTAPESQAQQETAARLADAQKETARHNAATEKTALIRANRPAVSLSGMNALYSQTDPKAIAQGIREGRNPPDISQYGRAVQGAIASELSKAGPNGERPFNLASAQREWKAQSNLNRTMNGTQQVRLDEAIRSGLAMYDQIDSIADQWDGKGWGPLSRANLEAARQGVKGPQAASIANQLTGQIGQLTSDVATIEQGGLTPTSEARAVAESSLRDWWSRGTIKDMTAQGRYNMQIRHLARETQAPMAPGNGINTQPAVPATPQQPSQKRWIQDPTTGLIVANPNYKPK